MSYAISPARLGISRRGAWLRGLLPCLVFLAGYAGLSHGAGFSERAIPQTPLHFTYYTLGLFVMGGMDLGTPEQGPTWARLLLWAAFFAAPIVTATAVLEALWALALPMAFRLRRLRDHTIVVGANRLAELYLQQLRARSPGAQVVLVDRNPNNPRLEALANKYPLTVINGDINSDLTLALLQLAHARRVLLMTKNDFTNLNAAHRMLEVAPTLAGRVVLHLSNLGLLHSVHLTRAMRSNAFFNSHEIAARQLVRDYLLARFEQTARTDLVVFAGFGRFGQCVLQTLQEQALGKFDEVLIADRDARAKLSAFEDRVGALEGSARGAVSGNLTDCELWSRLDREHGMAQREPLIIVGTDDDMVNLERGLWLRGRYPDAYIVVRQFRCSTFSAEIARERGLLLFGVADLISNAIPASWCTKPRALTLPKVEPAEAHQQES